MPKLYPTDWIHFDLCPRCAASAGEPCRDGRFRVGDPAARVRAEAHRERPIVRRTTAVPVTPPLVTEPEEVTSPPST